VKGCKNKVRILLLYAGTLSGHRQAARALKQALNKLYPEVEIRMENIFRHGHPCWGCLLDSLYRVLIRLIPWFWDFIWDSKEIYYLTYLLRSVLYRLNYLRLYKEIIVPFNPQAVVCTFNIACAVCYVIKDKKRADYLLAAVPTDFCLHPYWVYKNVDIYFLPHKGLKKKLLRAGVTLNKVQITGIPVSLDFSRLDDTNQLRRKWGVMKNVFTILLIGGGQGIGPLKEIMLTLNNCELPIQLLVVTGTNRHLRRKLQKIQPRLSFPSRILGYTREVDELMQLSDLLISKPGGLTVAEALVKETPLGILDSLAGQERRNREFLLKKGVAFELKSSRDIVGLVRKLLDNNSFDLENWQRRVRKLARPQAARNVAKKIMNLVEQRTGKFKKPGSLIEHRISSSVQ